MSTNNVTAARAVADSAEGQLLACVEIEAETGTRIPSTDVGRDHRMVGQAGCV